MQIKNKALKIYTYLSTSKHLLTDCTPLLQTRPQIQKQPPPLSEWPVDWSWLHPNTSFSPLTCLLNMKRPTHLYSKWGRRSESLNTEFEIVSSKSVFIMNHKNVIGGSRFSRGDGMLRYLETSLFFGFFLFLFFCVNLDSLSFRKLIDSLECFRTCFC